MESGISSGLDRLVEDWGLVDGDELSEYIGEAKKAEKHKEFFELAQQVGLGEDRVREDLVRCVLNFCPKEVSAILYPIEGFLNGDRN